MKKTTNKTNAKNVKNSGSSSTKNTAKGGAKSCGGRCSHKGSEE